jgi:hypothetical protein
MPRRWQPHHQDRTGRLTPCLCRNLAVFNKSMITHRQPMFLEGTMDSIIIIFRYTLSAVVFRYALSAVVLRYMLSPVVLGYT